MADSTIYLLGQAVTNTLKGLTLIDDKEVTIPPANIRQTILPRIETGIDPLPQVAVTLPDAPDKIEYMAFKKRAYYYTILITVITLNDQDITTPLDPLTVCRETIKNAFSDFTTYPVLGVPGVFDMRVELLSVFNRGMLAQNFNYLQMGLEFKALS